MSCLRWESINIRLGEEIFHISDNRDKEWEWQAQPETQTFKGFTFNVSSDVDLTGAIFLAKGVYSSHKGKMIEKIWEIPLIGMLKPIEGEQKMTLEETIVNLTPVAFGWLLGVGTTGIPKLYRWNEDRKIKKKYSLLINQIMDVGVYPLAHMLTPSAIEKKAKEGYPIERLNEKDRVLLFKL